MKRAALGAWVVAAALAAVGVWWADNLADGPRGGWILFAVAALAAVGLDGVLRRSDVAGRLIALTAAVALTAIVLAMRSGTGLLA